VVGNSSN